MKIDSDLFAFPFRDPRWKEKMLVGGLIVVYALGYEPVHLGHRGLPIGRSATFVAWLLVFVAAIQVFALAITHVNAPVIQQVVQNNGYPYAPGGTSRTGSVYNAWILAFFGFALSSRPVRHAATRRWK